MSGVDSAGAINVKNPSNDQQNIIPLGVGEWSVKVLMLVIYAGRQGRSELAEMGLWNYKALARSDKSSPVKPPLFLK